MGRVAANNQDQKRPRPGIMDHEKSLTVEDFALVRSTPLFVRLDEGLVRALITNAHVSAHASQVLLFSRGEPADRFFVVLSGRVKLFIVTPAGKESIIEFITAGQSFAEGAIFGSSVMPVSAEAMPGTRILNIPAPPILTRVTEDPTVGLDLLDSLARWQRQLIARVSEYKSHTPGARLAKALLDLTEVESGAAQVRLGMTKADLASRIGIAPESLSRTIARLKAHGVRFRGRNVLIENVATLRRLAADQGD